MALYQDSTSMRSVFSSVVAQLEDSYREYWPGVLALEVLILLEMMGGEGNIIFVHEIHIHLKSFCLSPSIHPFLYLYLAISRLSFCLSLPPFITRWVPTICETSYGAFRLWTFHLSRTYIPIHRIPSRFLEASPGRCPHRPSECLHTASPWWLPPGMHPLHCIEFCQWSGLMPEAVCQTISLGGWKHTHILSLSSTSAHNNFSGLLGILVLGPLGCFFPEGWPSFLSPLRAAPPALSSCTYLHPVL